MRLRIFISGMFIVGPVILFAQDSFILSESSEHEFYEAKGKEVPFVRRNAISKKDGVLAIKTISGRVVVFQDNLGDDYQTYEYFGDLVDDKICLVKGQDYHTDRYIAVNLITGAQVVLIGTPHVLGNKVICLQGSEPDTMQKIEVWHIRENGLVKLRSFSLPDHIYPDDIAWKGTGIAIIMDSKGGFWKIDLGRK